MFTNSSPFSDFVDATFLTIVGISTLVLIGLVAAMIYFVFRYHRKRNPVATNIEGNVTLEIVWTAVPLALFMGMFAMGWIGYQRSAEIPPNALPIDVTARMWQWTFSYPNGVVTDTLYVPVQKPVKLTLRSLDVNHSLYIPAFRIKKDAIPTKANTMWFSTPEPRAYDIACAEYCGLRHSYMYTKVVAMDSSAFEAWYRHVSGRQAKPYASLLSNASTTN